MWISNFQVSKRQATGTVPIVTVSLAQGNRSEYRLPSLLGSFISDKIIAVHMFRLHPSGGLP